MVERVDTILNPKRTCTHRLGSLRLREILKKLAAELKLLKSHLELTGGIP